MRTVAVGFVFLIAIILLVIGTLFIGKINLTSAPFFIEVYFKDITGIKKGDIVKVDGLEMGRVSNLRLVPEGVAVKLDLNQQMDIFTDYRISIEQTSLIGGHYVLVKRGTSGAKQNDLRHLQGSSGEMKEILESLKAMLKTVKETDMLKKMSNLMEKASKFFPF